MVGKGQLKAVVKHRRKKKEEEGKKKKKTKTKRRMEEKRKTARELFNPYSKAAYNLRRRRDNQVKSNTKKYSKEKNLS